VGAVMTPELLIPAQTFAERMERSKPGFCIKFAVSAARSAGMERNAMRDAKENRERIGLYLSPEW
jgi:hypothetical protein